MSPAKRTAKIHNEIFLCFLIHWTFIMAKPTIHPINAVLESVNAIANIRNAITAVFRITFLFAEKNALMDVNFCLKNNITTGRNAIKKYP